MYESMAEFVTGHNHFAFDAVLMLLVKCITMLLCFMFALFIAPLGLAYYLCHHSKNAA